MKCPAWLRSLCCCCSCCCEENKEKSPLLSGASSKEATPIRELQGISEVRVANEDDGEEVQEIEVSVVQESKEPELKDSPIELREHEPKRTSILELSTEEGPSERARVDSGTFVRNSGSRSSWRLLPTVSQQARDAATAKERETKEEKRKSAILTSSSNLGDGAIVFSDEAIDETERVVTLVSEDEGTAHETNVEGTAHETSVTVTISHAEVIDGPTEVKGQEVEKKESKDSPTEVDEGFTDTS